MKTKRRGLIPGASSLKADPPKSSRPLMPKRRNNRAIARLFAVAHMGGARLRSPGKARQCLCAMGRLRSNLDTAVSQPGLADKDDEASKKMKQAEREIQNLQT